MKLESSTVINRLPQSIQRFFTEWDNEPFGGHFLNSDMKKSLSNFPFDQINPTYPPHNLIEHIAIPENVESAYTIELGVAGFSEKDLTISEEDNMLKIMGTLAEKSDIGIGIPINRMSDKSGISTIRDSSSNKIDINKNINSTEDSSNKIENESTRYKYHGLNIKSFTQYFRIPKNSKISEAKLENGILRIDVSVPKESKSIRNIRITH